MVRLINKVVAPLKRRVMLMVGRAVVKAVADDPKMQTLQITLLAGEVHDNVERFQNYGFTSVPHPGAEAAVMFVGGLRSHGLVVAVDDRRYRLTGLEAGEVALYDDLGQKVHLKRDQILVSSPTKVVVDCPDVRLGGDGGAKVARIGDQVNVGSGSSAGMWPIVEGADNVSAV